MSATSGRSGGNKKYTTILVGILAIVAAHYYLDLKSYLFETLACADTDSSSQLEIKRNIIKSWSQFVQAPIRPFDRNVKFSIGVNTNVDLIVPAVNVFDRLSSDIRTGGSINHHNLKNLSQFAQCFGYFFRKGSAAERSFLNEQDFQIVINASTSLDHQQWFIGGNAALMAQGITQRFGNTDVLLVGPVGPRLKQLLDKRVRVDEASLIDKDEIHLILEYGLGDKYEKWYAPQANRFIVSHDWYNSRMEMLDQFFEITQSHQPDIIVLSGLHLLESKDEQFRVAKLQRLASLLARNTNKAVMTHLELASIGDKSLMVDILNERIVERVNSLGLNEQELLFLAHSSQSESTPHSDYYTELDGQPELYKVVDITQWLLNTFGASETNGKKLSRVHFHSLTFHLIAEIIDDKTNESVWSNTVASLLGGAKVASKQACGFDFSDESDLDERLPNAVELKMPYKMTSSNMMFKVSENDVYMPFNSSTPYLEFSRGRVRFYFTPVLVCKQPTKTVGLGDAISSTGLYYAQLAV